MDNNNLTEKSPRSQDANFLDLFPTQQRSLIANQFYASVRAGARSVGEVIAAVARDARERLAAGLYVTSQTRLVELLATEAARKFATEVICRESLPPQEKQRLKAARCSQYRQSWMKSQAPTEKQLIYLRVLGCAEIPGTRLRASELIDSWTTRGCVWG